MRILSGKEIKEMQAAGKKVVVDCYADWCGPCKMLGPIMEELAEEYAGKLEIVKLNVDDEQDFAKEYGVMSIPTVIAFNGNDIVKTNVGYQPKAAMEEFVKVLL